VEHEVALPGQPLVLVNLAQGKLDPSQPAGNPVVLRIQAVRLGEVSLRQDRLVGNPGVQFLVMEPLRDRPEMGVGQEQADLRLAGILRQRTPAKKRGALWLLAVTP